MFQLFTVRWPLLARLDAILFFPVALALAGEIAPVRTFVDQTLTPTFPSFVYQLGVSKGAAFWAAMVIAGFIPYLLLLIFADRFLTVRKGFALLSIVAVFAWAVAAFRLSPSLVAVVPAHNLGKFSFLSSGQHVALAAGGLALLIHLRPLWIGLLDQGDVAMRLVSVSGGSGYPEGRDTWARNDSDPFYRQAAASRGLNSPNGLDGATSAPGESAGMKFLYAMVWFSVVVGLAFAYLHWSSWNSGVHQAGLPAIQTLMPGVQSAQPGARPVMHPSPMAAPVSELPATPYAPRAAERPVETAALPSVQRPSEMVFGPDTTDPLNGPNEATAVRGKDGSFAFDAVVNGAHVPMLFDTGASVVALRAEDAERFGIAVNNLNYTAKVKTANGTADVAPIVIDTMTIGNITQRRVVGYVAREGMLAKNLLGQTFLARLSGYNVENNQLVLKGQ
jgi:clan AA aspartic protease (TIGR02281 family)